MLNKKNFIYKDQVSRLCSVMINAQALFEDLESLEQEGLFKQNLKTQTKSLLEQLEKSIAQIYGVGHKEVMQAIKEGKTDEEVAKIKYKHNAANLDITWVYDKAVRSRKQFDEMSFEEQLNLKEYVDSMNNKEFRLKGATVLDSVKIVNCTKTYEIMIHPEFIAKNGKQIK